MNHRFWYIVPATFGLGTLLSLASSSPIQAPGDQPEGVEVQARGPVHEAFAQPGDTQPQPSPIVTKQPPDPIEEMPPDQKPEGDNVQWIPGYFAWDEDTSNFIWVSGCWRAAPPGRRWMPGHWQEVEKGFMWVAGFWTSTATQEVQYLPPPPPTLDNGPSAPAPDAASLYAPGCWVYQQNRYLWRPGHWFAHQPNWVWMPAHYVWTPSGCLFIDDYWDHPLEECGLLFAPVRFDLAVWGRVRRSYIPAFVIQTDFLIGSLFVYAPGRHYFFGDYFEDRYAKRGFVAWTDFHPHAGIVDPLFGYYSHIHAGEPKWEPALRDLYRGRRTGEIPRPPHTLTEQVQVVKTINGNKTANVIVGKNINLTHVQNVTALAPLKEIHNTKVTLLGSLSQVKETKITSTTVKLATVPKADLAREQKVAAQMTESANQRRVSEAKMLTQPGIPVKHTDPPKTVKLTVATPPPVVVMPAAVRRTPPAVIVTPKHEERPIPKYEPPHPPSPPKKDKKG